MAINNQSLPKSRRGGARPGSGRKKGSVNQTPAIRRYIEHLNTHPLAPRTAANILSFVDELTFWLNKLDSPDQWLSLKAMMYLRDHRDGKATQNINTTSVNLNVSAQDLTRARETTLELMRDLEKAGVALPNSTEYLLSDTETANSNGCKVLDAVDVSEQQAKPEAIEAEALPSGQHSPESD